jgi:16S rRNA G966 N2-methylase RsmD
MQQLSKTVYFRDYPAISGIRSGLTIPFPEAELEAYRFVAGLSSYNIRQLLGFDLFSELEEAARRASRPVVTFAREIIKKNAPRIAADTSSRQAALQATFRGGKGSPLHEWYPYLEGYSPDFVTSIISEFAPDARRILDPFCGSGTTALVSALTGRTGLYSEVNPTCRFIIEAKAEALRISTNERHRLADQLLELSETLQSDLETVRPDEQLRRSFSVAFGDRPFFDGRAFTNVLKLRTLIDQFDTLHAHLARFLTVGVLRSLVPGSLLIRRGDLRFKNESELAKPQPDVVAEVVESIRVIASDLADSSIASGEVRMVCTDARTLGRHVNKPVDAIITSPPYLNGTNYFRNTKIELWFLRNLGSKNELRAFRDAAITSGINDVTMTKASVNDGFNVPKLLSRVLRELNASAYDQRIPLMVQSYFKEMNTVVSQLKAVSRPGTVAAIDLGDSCYGDVWVPTDQILTQLMERSGFVQTERAVLRERQSRDGRKLSQTLQVFEARNETSSGKRKKQIALTSQDHWVRFRDDLPHQQGEMAKRNWGHSWHSLCSYQGKLKPSIAHSLTKALMPDSGGRILDPFSGVGTIPFEARLQGHTAFGFDISPAAAIISRAKLELLTSDQVSAVLKNLQSWIKKHEGDALDLEALNAIKFNGPLPSYFHEDTLREIVAARRFFQISPAVDGASALVQSALLHILHGNRPYALSRRSHPITPFAPTGPTGYRSLMDRLHHKVDRCLKELSSVTGPAGRSFFQDVTKPWPKEVNDLDAVITSPPFFDSTRFHTANWMRLWFAGWESDDFAKKPAAFVDEQQKRTFEIYDTIFAQGAERLKRAGYLAVHLGKSAKCDMAAALSNIGARHLKLIDSFSESVSHCESHGIRDKGTVTHHQYLLFQRD